MGAIFSYSIFTSIILTGLYLAYKWVLAGENQHRLNRAILLSIYATALSIPFAAHISEALSSSDIKGIAGETEIFAAPDNLFLTIAPSAQAQSLWPSILMIIYIIGVATVSARTIITAIRLARIIRCEEQIKSGRFTIVITDNHNIAPFSWKHYIVMSRDDYDTAGETICIHETKHLLARHWIDLLAAQIIIILQWFNPSAWLMREELKTVHEYQADEAVLQAGVEARKYQMLLIKKAVGARLPSLANSLNHSKLKKRVTMMYKTRTSTARRLRAAVLVPALALTLAATDIPAVATVLDAAANASSSLSSGKDSEKTTSAQGSEITTTIQNISVSVDSLPTGIKVFYNGNEIPQDEFKQLQNRLSDNISLVKVCNDTIYVTNDSYTYSYTYENQTDTPDKIIIIEKNKKETKLPENAIYIINGTDASIEEVEALNPSSITGITIDKNSDKSTPKIMILTIPDSEVTTDNGKTTGNGSINVSNGNGSTSDDVKNFTINGREASLEEITALKPDSIAEMKIDKQTSTIAVTLK